MAMRLQGTHQGATNYPSDETHVGMPFYMRTLRDVCMHKKSLTKTDLQTEHI